MTQPVGLEKIWDLLFSNLQWIKMTWNSHLCSFTFQEELQLFLQPSHFLLSEFFHFTGYDISFIQKLEVTKQTVRSWQE